MDVLPYYLLAHSFIRFRATLTFKRYLPFFRFKERIVSATKEEIDDCVRQIDDFSPKKKALVLFATKVWSYVYERQPQNLPRYRTYKRMHYEWIESVKETTNSINSNHPTDLDNYEERSFSPRKRPYYPYNYPVLRVRYSSQTRLILGEPNPDLFVDEETLLRWSKVRDKFYGNEEIAFPAFIEPPEDSRRQEIKETLLRLVKSPLRFLVCTDLYQEESDWVRDCPNPRDVSSVVEWVRSLPKKDHYEPEFDIDTFERNLNFWIQWFKNIEDCVSIIRRELNLTISPERWISDYYPDADAFLKKVAELENDESAPYEKAELLVALREYWFSMQTSFDYDRFLNWFTPTRGTVDNPFYDDLGTKAVTLQDVVDFILQ